MKQKKRTHDMMTRSCAKERSNSENESKCESDDCKDDSANSANTCNKYDNPVKLSIETRAMSRAKRLIKPTKLESREQCIAEIAERYGSVYYIKSWGERNRKRPILRKRTVLYVHHKDKGNKYRAVTDAKYNQMIGVHPIEKIRELLREEKYYVHDKKDDPQPTEKMKLLGDEYYMDESEDEDDNISIGVTDEVTVYQNERVCTYLTDVGDYQHVDSAVDKFDLASCDIDEKLKVNALFVKILRNHPRPHRRAVYLDAPQLLTTLNLLASNLFEGKDALHIPNLNANFKEAVIKGNNGDLLNKITVHHMSMYECIRDVLCDSPLKWDVGFDYCCTLDGNKSIRPRDDIELLFLLRLVPRHNGVLWFTFSHRRAGTSIESTSDDLYKLLLKVASKNGYGNIKRVAEKPYSGVVYFIYVTESTPEIECCEKSIVQPSIQPPNIEEIISIDSSSDEDDDSDSDNSDDNDNGDDDYDDDESEESEESEESAKESESEIESEKDGDYDESDESDSDSDSESESD